MNTNSQEQPPEVFCKKRCFQNFCKFHRKTSVLKYLFNKVAQKQYIIELNNVLFSPSSKNKKKSTPRKFLIPQENGLSNSNIRKLSAAVNFRKRKLRKSFLYFLKRKLLLCFRKRKSRKNFLNFLKRNLLLYFGKSKTPKTS